MSPHEGTPPLPRPDGRGLSAMAVRRPTATLMAALMVVTLGLVAASRLAVDLIPDVDFPSVTVFAPYEGAGSLEIESLIVEPLEDAVASVPGLTELSSTARDGAGLIRLQFDADVDIMVALNDVRVQVERARGRMPDDLEPPQVFRFDPSQLPIMWVGISGDQDLREITRIARDDIKPQLSRVKGVAAVDIDGMLTREARVEISLPKMLDLEIPIDRVATALAQDNIDVTGGKVREGGREVSVRTVSRKDTAAELLKTPIGMRGDRLVRVGDVANIVDAASDPTSLTRIEGKTALRLSVRKGSGENTIAVAQRLRKRIKELNEEFPNVYLRTVWDTSVFIDRAVSGAQSAALIGGLLAFAMLLLFLKSFRATLLVAIAIPVSVLVSFIAMDALGSTLNLMTLGGIALAVGMLVDNAIVVLEAIVHHLERGKAGREAAIAGAQDIGLAVAASTATTLVIFLPVLFLGSIQRVIYGQMALVVVASLIASLVVSLTLVPAFAGRFFAEGGVEAGVGQSGRVLNALERGYGRLLSAVLARRFSTLALLLGIALASGAMIPRVQTELSPQPDQGQVEIRIQLPVGTPIEETDAVASQVVEVAKQVVPEADRIYTNVGSPGWWSSATSEVGRVSVTLPTKDKRPRSSEEVTKALRDALPEVPGATFGVRTSGGFFLLRMLQGGGEDRLTVGVYGENLDDMQDVGIALTEKMKAIPGISDATEPKLRGRNELRVRIDPNKAGAYGLSSEELGRQIETYVRGRRVTSLRTRVEEVPVIVRLAEEDRESIDQLARALVYAPQTGGAVPLGEIATLTVEEGPILIQRTDGSRVLWIGSQTEGRPIGDIAEDVRAAIKTLEIPKGVRVGLTGEAADDDNLMGSLTFGAILALLLVFMVMAAQFESLVLPLIVMGAVPFAGVGALILFGLHGTTLNLYSFMGLIVLVGIAVNNAIVLVDTANQMVQEGMHPTEAIREACLRRLRPIFMTTATTLLGLLPVALSQADGAELQGPLARVVVCGLLSSTAVTLLLIPILYTLVMERGRRSR